VVITDTVAPDPGGGRNYRLAVSLVSSLQTPDIVNSIRPGAGPAGRTKSQQELIEATWAATRLRVSVSGVILDPTADRTRCIERDREAIRDFVAGLGVVEHDPQIEESKCSCFGDYLFEFFEEDKNIASVSFHHATSLNWHKGPWPGDRDLTPEGIAFLKRWLDLRGMHVQD